METLKTTVAQRIRELLEKLCNQREQAYKYVLEAGQQIENYNFKVESINKIRTHLEAFKTCSETAHINLVVALHADIVEILPSETTTNKKLKAYREHILKMVTWCRNYSDQHKPK